MDTSGASPVDIRGRETTLNKSQNIREDVTPKFMGAEMHLPKKARKETIMAKIDTSKIEGYAGMTPDQKVAALEGLTIPDEVDLSQYVSKSTFDKKASEAAESSRQLKALKDANLSEEDRLKQERADLERERTEFRQMSNGAIVRGMFGAAGLAAESYSGLDIDHFTEEATARSFANGIIKMLEAQSAVAQQQARNDLLSASKSPAAGATPDAVSVLRSEFAEAKKNGDNLKMVTLIRKAAEKGVSLS